MVYLVSKEMVHKILSASTVELPPTELTKRKKNDFTETSYYILFQYTLDLNIFFW